MDVAQWLQDLGLSNYAALFREQAIDADVLPSLTDAEGRTTSMARSLRSLVFRSGTERSC